MTQKKHYGKHRGSVLNNVDPLNRGRILAQVASVSGLLPTSWCEPCLPLAGIQSGTWFVPQIGAGVWIEFEDGDIARPIWTGCFWGSAAEVPALALAGLPASPSIVLQTSGQSTLMLSDVPGALGGVLLQARTGAISISEAGITLVSGAAMISVTPGAITISNGTGASVVLGPGQQVALNLEALVVT
ncbi:baseplate assembly protein [Dankookia rubra]|uniref:Baseplate assembly protein n=1 Tax=Dankookia rubra TaxID=1442381 RepID=A0A4R5QGE5_9PROT|nr:phage baseplate assembly protein V [Dankookia rubra]TDH62146.1 baseplate assembly protein [Dankookia rubra]